MDQTISFLLMTRILRNVLRQAEMSSRGGVGTANAAGNFFQDF